MLTVTLCVTCPVDVAASCQELSACMPAVMFLKSPRNFTKACRQVIIQSYLFHHADHLFQIQCLTLIINSFLKKEEIVPFNVGDDKCIIFFPYCFTQISILLSVLISLTVFSSISKSKTVNSFGAYAEENIFLSFWSPAV